MSKTAPFAYITLGGSSGLVGSNTQMLDGFPPLASYGAMEAALIAAEQGDLTVTTSLLDALAAPYGDRDPDDHYRQPPAPEERVCQTFCGT